MADTHDLVQRIYAAFNRRDIDTLFAHMTEDVNWPMASEGGRVVGKGALRAYWGRQWQAFDPQVMPLEIIHAAPGTFAVRVRQVVKNLDGAVLSDTEVLHTYTTTEGLIATMQIPPDGVDAAAPAAAFARPH